MDILQNLLIWLPVLIFSIVVHEVAHGWVALKQGDQTALMLGRITLNPAPHIDPVGSLLVPGLLAVSGMGVMFGWAKPVPVNPRNYRNYKRGDILVSVAGVVANLGLAVMFAVVAHLAAWGFLYMDGAREVWETVIRMALAGVTINFVLIVFNLLPIPPLDGSHLFYYLLPPDLAARYRAVGGYGIFIIFGLLMLGGLRFIAPIMFLLSSTLLRLTSFLNPGVVFW